METIASAIKCSLCRGVLDSPVLLPCSDLICQRHVHQPGDVGGAGELMHCLECNASHTIPPGGFPEVKVLTKLLNAKINKLTFPIEYTNAFDSIRQTAKALDEFKLFQNDPYYFVNKTIGELKREVDLMRDQFKLKIDQKADELIQELEQYELECKSNLHSIDAKHGYQKPFVIQPLIQITNST
jgi:hypothetical protein